MSRQIEDFARALRELRRRAGSPSFPTMAAESGYSSSTLMDAVAGVELPSLTVTLAYVTACGGNVDAWQDRWRELAGGKKLVESGPVRRRRRRTLTRLPLGRKAKAGLLLAGVLAITFAATLLVNRGQPTPIRAAAPASTTDHQASSQQVAAPPPEYRAVAGPGCPMDFTRQIDISSANDDDGWREARGGSWTGDSCDDRFLYSAIDRDPNEPAHPENYFQWRFMLNGAAARRCLVEVYVPDSANASARVVYDVADRFENIEPNIGRFIVDQATSRGGWVSAASVSVGTAAMLVQIGTDGLPDRDTVAAGPLRVTCSRAG